ncbi:MAG: class I SAM-dependent methyltransferase [Desulfovibrionales bacterium]
MTKNHAGMAHINVYRDQWAEYELLDSGDRRKMERFGPYTLVRPEPKAWWRPDLDREAWEGADATLNEQGQWRFSREIPREWDVSFLGLTLQIRLRNTSQHLGVFPEQSRNWQWIMEQAGLAGSDSPKLLNLFGYTGAASMAAAASGFFVTHVDASGPAIGWAKVNQERSGLFEQVRFILEDAMAFVKRELRRGNRYEAILLDPPSWGRGPKKEVWKAETMVPELLELCGRLLSDRPLFLLLTMYNLDASSLMLGNLLRDGMGGLDGTIEVSELALTHSHSDKVLPKSICGLWKGDSP